MRVNKTITLNYATALKLESYAIEKGIKQSVLVDKLISEYLQGYLVDSETINRKLGINKNE